MFSAPLEIDVEYEGKDANIKAFLLRYIWKHAPQFEPDKILFRRVGKSSAAHKKAFAVAKRRDKDYNRIGFDELLQVIG